MGLRDILKRIQGSGGGMVRSTVTENIKERVSGAVGDNLPDGLSDLKDQVGELNPDDKQ